MYIGLVTHKNPSTHTDIQLQLDKEQKSGLSEPIDHSKREQILCVQVRQCGNGLVHLWRRRTTKATQRQVVAT